MKILQFYLQKKQKAAKQKFFVMDGHQTLTINPQRAKNTWKEWFCWMLEQFFSRPPLILLSDFSHKRTPVRLPMILDHLHFIQIFMKLDYHFIFKLDGVGPDDNRPSTD